MSSISSRIFNIMQYEKHPVSGESLIDEDTIKIALAHKTIKQWAYICHDADVYSDKDKADIGYKPGGIKPRHWHIVCRCDRSEDVSVIAKWFKIPENFVEVPKGHGAFLDCVQYLTHEDLKQQDLGKRLYADEKVKANFDFRAELDRRAENRLKYGADLNEKEQLRYNVMYGGWSLVRCEKEEPLLYMRDIDRLKKLRMDYLQRRAEMPSLRINYYIDGEGGIGKSVASRALARSLYPDYDGQCFFEVGGDKVSFDGYDGEPVVIWDDRRAAEMLQTFGRDQIFQIFDSHPSGSRNHIKFDNIRLVNQVNIVNGVEPYKDFLNDLAGEYKTRDGRVMKAEDRNQPYRRFPIIICVRENDFDILLNKGVVNGTREYFDYLGYKNLHGSFARTAQMLEGRAQEVVQINMLHPAIEATKRIKEHEANKIEDLDKVPDEFKQYVKEADADVVDVEEDT